jgi:hypothetical protein
MTADPVRELAALSHTFGGEAAAQKRRLLETIAAAERFSARGLRELQDTLGFMLAYPDSPAVLAAVNRCVQRLRPQAARATGGDPGKASFLNSGLPGSTTAHVFGYEVVRRLAELFPGSVDVDWDEMEDEMRLSDALAAVVSPAEARGLDDEGLDMETWLRACRARPGGNTLETILDWLERWPMPAERRSALFDGCELPVRFSLAGPGRGRLEAALKAPRIRYQTRVVPRETFSLPPRIRRPIAGARRLSPAAGRRRIDLSLLALGTRNLEIYPLIHADPARVTVVPCGRGFELTLAQVVPERRTVPEALFFFLIRKNGVPVAYGPASVFLGCCEMGINLFPEFRGGEIRYLYTQFMRVLYHLAFVRYFYVVPYGMGEDNEEALASGAFWFYRKLGFRASNPRVEALAREEEATMRKKPGYRSPRPVLRRLSHTYAVLDLSRGTVPRFNYARLGRRVTRLIDGDYGGDRVRARRGCVRRLVRALGITGYDRWDPRQKTAMEQLAPCFAVIPGLERWSARERSALAVAIRARGRDEFAYLKALARTTLLTEALGTAGESGE